MFLLFTVEEWLPIDIEELDKLPVDEQWYGLGQALGVSVQELENIQKSEASLVSRKSKMFRLWVKNNPEASREKLATSLDEINETELANDIWSDGADFASSGYGSLQSSTLSVFRNQVRKEVELKSTKYIQVTVTLNLDECIHFKGSAQA